MSSSDLKHAIKKRDFIVVAQKVLPEYAATFPSQPSVDYSVEDVEAAAEAAGLTAEWRRDQALAPLMMTSRIAIENYRKAGGKPVGVRDNGEIYIKLKSKKGGESEKRISSPLIIVSEGYTVEEGGACLIVLVRSTKGKWKELCIPRYELVNRGNLQNKLQAAGLLPGNFADLLHLLQNIDPPRKFLRIESAGWNGDHYALPGGEVIPVTDGAVATFQKVPYFDKGGTLEGSRELLVTVEDQSRIVFAVAAGLSAPFLADYGPEAEPGGFHFYGASSRGKTTLLTAAASMFGRGAESRDQGIIGSWNITAYAAEHSAQQHSDCLMLLDELKVCDPVHFAKLNLQLANGSGKKAGNSNGSVNAAKTFRPVVLSTGEVSTKDYITGSGGTYNAGMSVRLIDVPAETESGYGIFDSVPERFNQDAGSFARYIKSSAGSHYGHFGRLLVEHYMKDRASYLNDMRLISASVYQQLEARGGNTDAQTGRVASRFAFVAAASMVACERGLLPWAAESVLRATLAVFDCWFIARGGVGSQDGIAAEHCFNAFVYAHPGRFALGGVSPDQKRLGMKRLVGKTHEIWVANDQGLAEMLGKQPERIKPFLEHLKAGHSTEWILYAEKGRNKRDAPRGHSLPDRCYCFRSIREDIFSAANDDNDDNLDVAV